MKNQKGLAPIVVILIMVIIVVLVGFGGWLIFETRKPESEVKKPEIEKPAEKPVEEIPFNLTTTKLATAPEDVDFIAFSPDGRRVAYTVNWSMVIDGQKGKDYDWISPEGPPIFSPDSKKVAYIGWEGGKAVLVVNNKEEGKVYDDIKPHFLLFSPDGQKIAYIAKKEGKEFVIVNEKEGKTYDMIIRPPLFSHDGQKIAYVAEKEGKSLVIINEKESKPYDYVKDLIFSSDSKQIAYVTGEKVEGKERVKVVVISEKEEKIYEGCENPIFSPDSQQIACICKGEKGFFVTLNGTRQENYYDWINKLVFSPDSKQLAYVAGTFQPFEEFVIVSGKKGKSYDEIRFFTFSPDSRKIAYVAVKGDKIFIVINDEESKAYEWYEDLPQHLQLLYYYLDYPSFFPIVFSPDSEKIAYIAKKEDKWMIVINSKEGKLYDIISPPIFSPDGQKIAYVVGEGKEMIERMLVVVNDKEGKAYDMISGNLQFSPDGKYLAFGAALGNELWWVVEKVEEFGEK